MICTAAGLLTAFAVHVMAGVVAGVYVVLQCVYNLRAKRVRMVDVVAIACGFVLRAAAGAGAIGLPISIWLVLCVFFLCLYLGFVKRFADLTTTRLSGASDWTSPAGYTDPDELRWLLAFSASLCVTTYVMYSLSGHTAELFGPASIGFALLTPLVVICVHRFYLRASVGLSDRPVDALFQDRVVPIAVALYVLGIVLLLYVPAVGRGLGVLFFR
jgi:4-hydroxybenzoate polyprenyltransferase